MMKKFFLSLSFVLFALSSTRILFAESPNNGAASFKSAFITQFKNRFPQSVMKTLDEHFDEFLADAQALLKKDGDLLILVDKKNLITADYKIGSLVLLEKYPELVLSKSGMYASSVAVDAFIKMFRQARSEGVTIVISSAYRSYDYQKNLFARYVRQYGEAEAVRFSARAGTSQHQLGTVFDFGTITDDWAQTKAGKWVAKNAAKFGFSLSFPKGYETITGYKWECWHFRYIGRDACAMQAQYFDNIQQYMLEALHFINKNLIQ